MRGLLAPVRFVGLPKRRLTEATCRHWRYGSAVHAGEPVQVAQYAAREGQGIVAQKWRSKDKRFGWVGDARGAESLYGRHLWRDAGRKLVVTEGELDAISVSQVQDHKWAVVSLANGSGSAEAAFRANLEWLERFDEVILMFDQDEAGEKAVQAAAPILSPGRVKVARLPLKDASDMLQAGRDREIVDAIFGARAWRPDGVLEGDALWARATRDASLGSIPYPWQGLQQKLRGLRPKEIVTICAGTGIGKSTLARELGVHLVRSGERVGWVALEENPRQSLLGMLGILAGQHLRAQETTDWAALRPLWDEHLAGRIALLDHFGSLDSKTLLSRVRYLAKGVGCRWIVFDHLTIAISGQEGENERKDIDVLMSHLRALTEECECGLILVSQLKRRGQGPQYEDGAVPRLSDLRGSAAIEQLSDVVIAAGREQSKGENMLDLHVLKNRPVGLTGPAGALEWGQETGTYREVTLFEPETAS